MIDYKEIRKCTEPKIKLSDYLTTCLMIAAVLSLFALATYELTKTGGALDHALGVEITKQQQQNSEWRK